MADAVLAVTDDTFEDQVVKAELPTVVDFWAEWCGPCQKVGPIIEELGAEYQGKVQFAKLDVDGNAVTATMYAVMSIPTVMLFKDGDVVDKMIGVRSKADYKSWIDSNI